MDKWKGFPVAVVIVIVLGAFKSAANRRLNVLPLYSLSVKSRLQVTQFSSAQFTQSESNEATSTSTILLQVISNDDDNEFGNCGERDDSAPALPSSTPPPSALSATVVDLIGGALHPSHPSHPSAAVHLCTTFCCCQHHHHQQNSLSVSQTQFLVSQLFLQLFTSTTTTTNCLN